MKEKRYWLRAVGTALLTTVGALLVFDAPPDLAGFWRPVLLGVQAGLVSLGLNIATRNK